MTVKPVEALRRIAFLLERADGASRRSRAYRQAARTIAGVQESELARLAAKGRLRDLPGIGPSTEEVVRQALDGKMPGRLAELLKPPAPELDGEAAATRAALRGDCHTHSEWSDGNTPILDMAQTAIELGHDYIVLTDHSPTLRVANGLSAARLQEQLDYVEELNSHLAPFRILTGIEVDILPDGALDQHPELLARLDVVVASVHSKLRMPPAEMTPRMLAAINDPNMDVLGHCTGRKIRGERARPESAFDADAVFEACRANGKAIEINCRPDRLDPPRRLLRLAKGIGCLFSIDSDAHAPGELDWLGAGCARAAECGVATKSIVNTWSLNRLLEWTAGHAGGRVP